MTTPLTPTISIAELLWHIETQLDMGSGNEFAFCAHRDLADALMAKLRECDVAAREHATLAVEVGSLKEAAHAAVQDLVRVRWLYGAYGVRDRGPLGLIVDAIERLQPEAARRIRECEVADDWTELVEQEPGP